MVYNVSNQYSFAFMIKGAYFKQSVREPFKKYLVDFVRYGGVGVPPLSAKGFWAG